MIDNIKKTQKALLSMVILGCTILGTNIITERHDCHNMIQIVELVRENERLREDRILDECILKNIREHTHEYKNMQEQEIVNAIIDSGNIPDTYILHGTHSYKAHIINNSGLYFHIDPNTLKFHFSKDNNSGYPAMIR